MSETVQKLAPKILEEIKKAKNILLHCHPSPDADSLGSTLAMLAVIESLGKKATLIGGDSDTPSSFSILPGFEKIVQKNFFGIDLSVFDLFIILDSGGLRQISRVAPMAFPENLKTINIDHHATNEKYAQINLVDATYPATCLIVYDLLVAWNIEITPEIAKCLILGIFTDTGGFRYGENNIKALVAAANLAEIAPDYTSVISYMENSNSPGMIAFQGLALSKVSLYCGNKVAISAVSNNDLQEKKITKGDLYPDIANILKSVVGWEIGIKMVEDVPGGVRISMRTRDAKKYDVSKIATALGGGGHVAAAGAYLEMPIDEAVKKVVATISSVYPELS